MRNFDSKYIDYFGSDFLLKLAHIKSLVPNVNFDNLTKMELKNLPTEPDLIKGFFNNKKRFIKLKDKDALNLLDKEMEEMCKTFGEKGIKKLFELKRADLKAQNPKYHYSEENPNNLNELDKQEKRFRFSCIR